MKPGLFLLVQWLVTLGGLGGEPTPLPRPALVQPAEVFVGGFRLQGRLYAVMGSTEVTLDGVRTPFWDVPDEDTELVEIGIDLRRNVLTRMAYVTRKDF